MDEIKFTTENNELGFPETPLPEIIYENNGVAGLVIGIIVLGAIIIMVLNKIL